MRRFFNKNNKDDVGKYFDKEHAKRKSPKRLSEKIEHFPDYKLWDILSRCIKITSNLNFLEVGSAPGNNLVYVNKILGCVPYGIELSKGGVEYNRKLFKINEIPFTDNVINADFFDDNQLEEFKFFFDIVFSYGFIEHFDDIDNTVKQHLKLLKDDGYIIIVVPNFRFINYLLLKLFSPESLDLHNFSVMNKHFLKTIFNRCNVTEIYCGYYGYFNPGLFNPHENTIKRRILKRIKNIYSKLLNPLFFFLDKINLNINCRIWSPYLIYVGKK